MRNQIKFGGLFGCSIILNIDRQETRNQTILNQSVINSKPSDRWRWLHIKTVVALNYIIIRLMFNQITNYHTKAYEVI